MVDGKGAHNKDIVILVFATDLGNKNTMAITPAGSSVVTDTGAFWFFLPAGQYYLFAFL